MAAGRTERFGPADEKVTINLGPVDLGRIDLLVEEGFYSTRSDFVRAAIRGLLDEHRQPLDDVRRRRSLAIGVISYSRTYLEELREKNERAIAHVVGVVHIDDDVSPELADAAIERVWVLGRFSASPEVKRRLGAKVERRSRA
jgi:Arc/MetJ-type ribon-helix-helix transcriptional regulator